MSKIVWDATTERLFETGVDHAVLYPMSDIGAYTNGVAWNGIVSISENPSGAEANPQYADNIKYLNLLSAEDYGSTIECFTYPPEFNECNGIAEVAPGGYIGQQSRRSFGLCYRTLIGNDVKGQDYGYKLHMIYNATASPSEQTHDTVNESPEAETMSFEISTTPITVTGRKPTATFVVDSTRVDSDALARLEAILYGTDNTQPRLPLPDEIISILTTDVASFEVVVPSANETVLGMKASDLQSGIRVSHTAITGTLKYVEDFTGFNASDPDEQEGNYLFLEFVPDPSNATVTVELVGGKKGPVTLDEDGQIVLRITDIMSQMIRVTVASSSDTTTKEYNLSSLILQKKSA